MLSKQDDLARRRDRQRLKRSVDRHCLHLRREELSLGLDSLEDCPRSSLVDNADGSCLEQCRFEVVDEVLWVFDTDTESDEVLGQVALSASLGVDRGVAARRM